MLDAPLARHRRAILMSSREERRARNYFERLRQGSTALMRAIAASFQRALDD